MLGGPLDDFVQHASADDALGDLVQTVEQENDVFRMVTEGQPRLPDGFTGERLTVVEQR